MDVIGGKIGLEIEIKGPDPEAPGIVAEVLARYRQLWDGIEVTSFEPMILRDMQQRCPGLTTDLLLPQPPDWMRQDVLTYEAIQRGRLAGAQAVHLPATKLSPAVVSAIRAHGFDIHVWDVNDDATLAHMLDCLLGIRRVCTDNAPQIVNTPAAARRMTSGNGSQRQAPPDYTAAFSDRPVAGQSNRRPLPLLMAGGTLTGWLGGRCYHLF